MYVTSHIECDYGKNVSKTSVSLSQKVLLLTSQICVRSICFYCDMSLKKNQAKKQAKQLFNHRCFRTIILGLNIHFGTRRFGTRLRALNLWVGFFILKKQCFFFQNILQNIISFIKYITRYYLIILFRTLILFVRCFCSGTIIQI